MDDHALRVLDFTEIRERLAGLAVTALGKASCATLQPATDPAEVQCRQDETAEARRLLVAEHQLPLSGVLDVRDPLWWAQWSQEAGFALKPGQLRDIGRTAAAISEIRDGMAAYRAQAPLLAARATAIGDFAPLATAIARAITDAGAVAPEASPALARLTDAVHRQQQAAQALLAGTAADPVSRIAWRDDRLLLAIPAAARPGVPGGVPGEIRGTADGGKILLIEPPAVVAVNDTLVELAAAVQAETAAVLRALTARVKADAEALGAALAVVAALDAALARGQMGLMLRGETPVLSPDGHLELRRARHPLLGGRVVPIDVHLGVDFDLLLVSGPNTGGKTVTLKTVGLLCLMAQAGLQIPAAAGSRVPVYPAIYADIGDEQSIEQNLSTFSGHLNQIVRILGRLAPGSLVLLDELGAGTDPVAGVALATVILERLQAGEARVMATTHYAELKALARTHRRVENAAMSFDPQTLHPTFRLRIGEAGESQAFAIARRLGLDPALVEAAVTLAARRR